MKVLRLSQIIRSDTFRVQGLSLMLLGLLFAAGGQSSTAVAADCITALTPTAGGHYNNIGYYAVDRHAYMAGMSPEFSGSELRNWFAFNIPTLPAPLTGAQLRLPAYWMESPDASERYELHEILTSLSKLTSYTGDTTNTFKDLGDGPIFGSRLVSTNDNSVPLFYNEGGYIVVPFTPAGLAALTAAQGSSFAVGGAVATLDTQPNTSEMLFRGGYAQNVHIQLLLFLASSAPPQLELFSTPSPVVANTRVSLAAAACGATPLSLQWLKDGEIVPGATNDTLEIPFSRPSDSGLYRLRASNSLGEATSADSQVAVAPLRIVNSPQSVTVEQSHSLTLYVYAVSELPMAYQWRKNGVNVLGATSQSLTFTSIGLADAGDYDVLVSNIAGSVTSAVARVSVFLRPPQINFQPISQEVAVGLPTYVAVSVTGSEPLTLQWYKNDQPLPGANAAFLQNLSTQFSDAGNYYLIAQNPAGSATSDVAQVTVVGLQLTGGPAWTSSLVGNSATALVYFNSSVRVHYQWYYNNAPLPGATEQLLQIPALELRHSGDYFLVASNIYLAITSSVATLTVTTQPPAVVISPSTVNPLRVGDSLTLQANVSAGPPALLQWRRDGVPLPGATSNNLHLDYVTLEENGIYTVAAQNLYGSATSAPVNVQIITQAPFFVLAPNSTNEVAGSITQFRAVALGGPPPTYQWKHDGAPIPGATNATLFLPDLTPEHTGIYEAVAQNQYGQTSISNSLVVRPQTGLDQWRWRRPQPQGNRLYQVTAANGRYVAVGKSGNLISSADGSHWSNVIVEADCDLETVGYGNGRFVAAGRLFTTGHFVTNVSIYPSDLSGILLTSEDGLNWTTQMPPEGDTFNSIAFGNGRFVASTRFYQKFAYTSADGVHWTPQRLRDRALIDVVWGNGRFLGTSGDRLYTSADGLNWEIVYASPYVYLNKVATGDNGFIAIATSGAVFTSATGETWSERGFIGVNPSVISVAFGSGRWIVTGNFPAGSVAISLDAANWTLIDTGTAQEIMSAFYASDHFIAVGEAVRPRRQLVTSMPPTTPTVFSLSAVGAES